MQSSGGAVISVPVLDAGSKAAQRLAAEGFQVTAWNRNAAKAEALVELGLDFKAAQHEAVEECDVAVLFLADADAIESILFSNERALAALRGKTVIQMGTIGEPTQVSRHPASSGWHDCVVGKTCNTLGSVYPQFIPSLSMRCSCCCTGHQLAGALQPTPCTVHVLGAA